ncbi:MAG: zinc ribbon domain-containing protein [Euryarchaeota archaeon]|nr:zinc ribbon domain-containing protein [Euryarchaeota archaeon]
MGVISPLLSVRNMLDTIEFYRNSLGFEMDMAFPDADNPQYASLTKDEMSLMFDLAENIGVGGDEKLGVGLNLYLNIDTDIDEYYDELKRKNVRITVEIKDEPFGIRDFTVEDVNGYKLTFNQPSKNVRKCMSCGMPMVAPEDFGGGSTDNAFCAHCTTPEGRLKSYDDVLEGMTGFMMMTRKMDRTTAKDAAREYMSEMPAWG